MRHAVRFQGTGRETRPVLSALVAWLVLLLAPAVAGSALAHTPKALLAQADYVVAPDGDDSNPGTVRHPFRTIAQAARVARAGDLVVVRPGLYPERIKVEYAGTARAPIVFQAEHPGRAVITGAGAGFRPDDWAGEHDTEVRSGNHWVTLRGFTFRDITEGPAVRAATGWRIEDCRFERVYMGINIRGHHVVVRRTVLEDIDSEDAHAIVAYGGRGIRIEDVTIRRVNTQARTASIARSAVTKFLDTDGLVVDRLVSEGNLGPGLWLDWDNRNFVIRNSIIRANRGHEHWWEGSGIWLEGNPEANGRVYGNRIEGNSGAGIGLLESSGIEIFDNQLIGNGVCIELRNLDRGDGGRRVLRDIHLRNNLRGAWTRSAVATSVGEWKGWDPADHNVTFDHGRYSRAGAEGPLFDWLGDSLGTLSEVRARLGFERGGEFR